MRDSSVTRPDAFERLTWHQVVTMLSVLRECEYTKTEHVKKRYVQRGSNFTETLGFLSALGAIEEEAGHIRLSGTLRPLDASEDRFWLFRRLFGKQNRYRTEIAQYLRNFRVVDGELVYRPSFMSRDRQSHVRNLLMELGIVHHDSGCDLYRIHPEHFDTYVMAQGHAGERSPAAVAADRSNKSAIGAAAEEAVVFYERKRVGNAFASRVEHVALRNVAAGYDVRSVTIAGDDAPQPRYIEVKAVSGSSLQFHWTRNEVLTAQLFGRWYFLYLVPVETGGRFAMDGLRVLQDPHATILREGSDWVVEPDVLRCFCPTEGPHNSGVSENDR